MALSDLISLTPKGKIGSIDIEVLLEEVHTDDLQITEHPVQHGASISDHSFKRPSSVVLRCGWSNSSYAALGGIVTSLFSGGGVPSAEYVAGVYSQLLALRESRVPFSITTTLRQYDNMMMSSLNVTRDKQTANILMVTATCREVIIVDTRSVALPPKENQANPEQTAEVEQAGVKQVQNASPAPGGSLPADEWSAKSPTSTSLKAPTPSTFE